MSSADHDVPETSESQGEENLVKRRRTAGPGNGGLSRLFHMQTYEQQLPPEAGLHVLKLFNSKEKTTTSQELQQHSNGDCANEDRCFVCGDLGEVCCCDTCPKVYHLNCLPGRPKANDLPDSWRCPECIENTGTGSENASANSSAENMDCNIVPNAKPQNFSEKSKVAKRVAQAYASSRSGGLSPRRGRVSGRSRGRRTRGSRSVSRRGGLRSSSNYPRDVTIHAQLGADTERVCDSEPNAADHQATATISNTSASVSSSPAQNRTEKRVVTSCNSLLANTSDGNVAEPFVLEDNIYTADDQGRMPGLATHVYTEAVVPPASSIASDSPVYAWTEPHTPASSGCPTRQKTRISAARTPIQKVVSDRAASNDDRLIDKSMSSTGSAGITHVSMSLPAQLVQSEQRRSRLFTVSLPSVIGNVPAIAGDQSQASNVTQLAATPQERLEAPQAIVVSSAEQMVAHQEAALHLVTATTDLNIVRTLQDQDAEVQAEMQPAADNSTHAVQSNVHLMEAIRPRPEGRNLPTVENASSLPLSSPHHHSAAKNQAATQHVAYDVSGFQQPTTSPEARASVPASGDKQISEDGRLMMLGAKVLYYQDLEEGLQDAITKKAGMIRQMSQAEKRIEAVCEALQDKRTMFQKLQIDIEGLQEEEQEQQETMKNVAMAIERLQDNVSATKVTMTDILSELRIRPSTE